MASQLHFILVPLMAPGHMIPLIDIGKLLAKRSVIVTIVTTPINASRFKPIIDHASESGLPIRLLQLQFPSQEAGLPEGCENLDNLPVELVSNFFMATAMLQQPLEQSLQELQPKPSCIISDMGHPWTSLIADKFQIPRLIFHGTCCFSLLCAHNVLLYKVRDSITSSTEPFLLPGMPDPIKIKKTQLPGIMVAPSYFKSMTHQFKTTEATEYGIVVNSFSELEQKYVKEYQKAKGKSVWCVGPVSLCSKERLEKIDRGDKASIDEHHCLQWLDSWVPKSVLYVCLGSLCRLTTLQLIELGLSLEACDLPFIWAFKSGEKQFLELEKWASDGFEERVKGRGLIIRGWAPQLLILSHSAIGGFLTHCGWNSALEGICAGVPMITWPMFAEQFTNEKLIVEVLRIGVRVGVDIPVRWGEEEETGVLVKREDIGKAIGELMEDGQEGDERRKRAKELAEKAKMAMEEGGSSHLSMTLLIEDIKLQSSKKMAS